MQNFLIAILNILTRNIQISQILGKCLLYGKSMALGIRDQGWNPDTTTYSDLAERIQFFSLMCKNIIKRESLPGGRIQ